MNYKTQNLESNVDEINKKLYNKLVADIKKAKIKNYFNDDFNDDSGFFIIKINYPGFKIKIIKRWGLVDINDDNKNIEDLEWIVILERKMRRSGFKNIKIQNNDPKKSVIKLIPDCILLIIEMLHNDEKEIILNKI